MLQPILKDTADMAYKLPMVSSSPLFILKLLDPFLYLKQTLQETQGEPSNHLSV